MKVESYSSLLRYTEIVEIYELMVYSAANRRKLRVRSRVLRNYAHVDKLNEKYRETKKSRKT